MKTVDLSDFVSKMDNPETRAYQHALDLSFLVAEELEKQGLSKTDLANRMGVSLSRLANMLNSQPNMTLKSIAMFEKALGIALEFRQSKPAAVMVEIDSSNAAAHGSWVNEGSKEKQKKAVWSNEPVISRADFSLVEGGLAA